MESVSCSADRYEGPAMTPPLQGGGILSDDLAWPWRKLDEFVRMDG
jgi:hypothetical protein